MQDLLSIKSHHTCTIIENKTACQEHYLQAFQQFSVLFFILTVPHLGTRQCLTTNQPSGAIIHSIGNNHVCIVAA